MRLLSALGACALLVLASSSNADAPTAPHIGAGADAEELLDGARVFDARAELDGAKARTAEAHAQELSAQAAELRRQRVSDVDRVAAKAADLEVQAGLARAGAARHRLDERSDRARASALRDLAKSRTPAVASARRVGTVSILASSSCEAQVDGIPAGSTPVIKLKLPVGAHVVECQAGDTRPTTIAVSDGVDSSVRLATSAAPPQVVGF